MRRDAKNTYYASQDSRERYQGLTMWTPTVNIYRDPRWGRGIGSRMVKALI
ncbi:MAG: hypothetical protein ACLUE2_08710 [Bacteroides cellulosilyticus]